MTTKSDSDPNSSKSERNSPASGKAPPGPRETALSREPNRFIRFLKILGPGLITGASDDDLSVPLVLAI